MKFYIRLYVYPLSATCYVDYPNGCFPKGGIWLPINDMQTIIVSSSNHFYPLFCDDKFIMLKLKYYTHVDEWRCTLWILGLACLTESGLGCKQSEDFWFNPFYVLILASTYLSFSFPLYSTLYKEIL